MAEELDVTSVAVQGVIEARDALSKVMDPGGVFDFPQTFTAMQNLPPDMVEEVGAKIVEKHFEAFGKDPKDADDRSEMIAMDESISTAIETAGQLIIQQLRNKIQSQQNIMQGTGNVIS